MATTTTTTPFTEADVPALVAAVRQAAADHPTRVYDKEVTGGSCNYAPDETNVYGCIVGHAARQIGHSFDWADTSDDNAISDLLGRLGVPQSPTVWWLVQVQVEQDIGYSWSESVARADKAPL